MIEDPSEIIPAQVEESPRPKIIFAISLSFGPAPPERKKLKEPIIIDEKPHS